MRSVLAMMLVGAVCWGGSLACLPNGDEPPESGYRQAMRDFVEAISAYAKGASPGFIVIPQNGHELIAAHPTNALQPATDYLAAIDGVGREDLFYGYTDDNVATPAAERDAMLPYLDLAEANAVEVLVTDYCCTHGYVDASYAGNAAHGFIAFAADHRDLDNIPAYPVLPYNHNANNIATLSDATNFLYVLDPGGFALRQAYLDALAASRYDLFIIDLFYDDMALTAAEVAALKTKPQGGTRLVIAYMSIGEAEDYRYYWDPQWRPGSPSWLEAENPDWHGNYVVRYWEQNWQDIIFGSGTAYLDRILGAGFDGVYLDIIDAYEYFEAR